MASRKITCELCGRTKSVTNHWLIGSATNERVLISLEGFPHNEKTSDICGERCAADFVAFWVHQKQEKARSQKA